MSLQYARRAAERILGSLPHGPAIDPHMIADHLRVPVIKETLEQSISGLLIINGGKARIVVNKADDRSSDLFSPRQRFSIAHELGHFVLKHYEQSGDHVHVDKGFRILQRGLKSQGIDPVEVEANQFAASLLMPASSIRTEISKLLEGEPIDECTVANMAAMFQVSVMAMIIRLHSLGFLD